MAIREMIYETFNDITLPKIGFGTARVGGRIIPNHRRDPYWMTILCSALELGFTHFDTAELYALGYSERLIGRAMRDTGTKREDILITTKVWPIHLRYHSLLLACQNSLRRLNVDYIDVYLIHIPNPLIALKDSFQALNQLVREGKIKHIGVSNFNLKLLQEAQSLSETPIVTNQIPYSMCNRLYEKNGVIKYCQENNMLITAYTPLGHNQIQPNNALQSIAKVHHATLYQIALAWLVAQPRVITIPMAFNPIHQKENLEAASIKLSETEMEQLRSA